MTAMTRGIYISQKTARQLGVPNNWPHPDLWFEERGLTTGKVTSNGLVGLAGEALLLPNGCGVARQRGGN